MEGAVIALTCAVSVSRLIDAFDFSCRFVCRLYLYPRLVLFTAGGKARTVLPTAPFYFFFNAMLWILFGLNLYWFYFIMWLILRVVSGKSREVEDTREIPVTNKVII